MILILQACVNALNYLIKRSFTYSMLIKIIANRLYKDNYNHNNNQTNLSRMNIIIINKLIELKI